MSPFSGVVNFWIMAVSSLLNFFMPISAAVDSKCDHYQSLVMGQEYYVYNYEYPATYSGQMNCRWLGESIGGSKIVVSCEDVSLPSVSILDNKNVFNNRRNIFRLPIAMEIN